VEAFSKSQLKIKRKKLCADTRFFFWQSGTALKIALRTVVCELQCPKGGQFQRGGSLKMSRISKIFEVRQKKLHEKRPFSTFKSLQGGHVDLADTPVVFLSGLW
jgi:hypothetical protein